MTYLVIPNQVDNFPIAIFLSELYQQHSININLPIGLISYDTNNSKDLTLEIDTEFDFSKTPRKKLQTGSRYWAKYIDTSPHLVWLLIDLAYQEKSKTNRKDIIWRKFFDKYYFPIKHRTTFKPFQSDIDWWGIKKMEPFKKTLIDYSKKINAGEIFQSQAQKELNQKINPNFSGDNLYNSYGKNYLPFVDHLNLWDDQKYLTDEGYEFHKQGKIHNPSTSAFKDYFAKVVLVNGKHLDLIVDLEEFIKPYCKQKNQTPSGAREYVFNEFYKKGYVTQNPNRTKLGKRTKTYFSDEFALWDKLNFINKTKNSSYISNYGFDFNWREITRISQMV